VERFSRTLNGPKAIVVGRSHLPMIEKVLRGEAIEQPPVWSSYMQTRISGPNQKASENFMKIAGESL
jgi:hypothetical protein